jgi:hypothetical protein
VVRKCQKRAWIDYIVEKTPNTSYVHHKNVWTGVRRTVPRFATLTVLEALGVATIPGCLLAMQYAPHIRAMIRTPSSSYDLKTIAPLRREQNYSRATAETTLDTTNHNMYYFIYIIILTNCLLDQYLFHVRPLDTVSDMRFPCASGICQILEHYLPYSVYLTNAT